MQKLNPNKIFFLTIVFMITIIVLFHSFSNSNMDRLSEIQLDYFKNFDLKLTGVICNIEERFDTHKYLIVLKVLDSNHNEYEGSVALGAEFCMLKNGVAVFADHHRGYMIGDKIEIGSDKINLIICYDSEGNFKFLKERDKAMLYNMAPPQKRMKELMKRSCLMKIPDRSDLKNKKQK